MAYLAMIFMIAVLSALLLYIFLTDEKTTKAIKSLQGSTDVLEKIDEILDDRTAIGAARARIKPSGGSDSDFTDFDPHDFEREYHIVGAAIDFVDATPTEADPDAVERLKKELGSQYGSVAGKLFKVA
jgi:hypothetical protein